MHEEKTLILSSALFPPIGWFALLYNHKNCLIEAHETYSKQTYRNRFSILSANEKLDLNVPVKKINGNHTVISDILIISDENIIRNHLTALESAYKSSPYFDFFFDEIKIFYTQKYKSLLEMNLESIKVIEKILRHKFEFQLNNKFVKEYNSDLFFDLRFDISPKNIQTENFKYPEYYQTFEHKFGFVQNLSILDLVFNLGLETLLYLKRFPVEEYINHITKK